jgi:hypothetical protein
MLKVPYLVAVLVPVLASVTAAQSAPSSADRAAIARAGEMYYNLQREGVRELRCKAHPDWQQILASMIATGEDAKARALPYLSNIAFRVTATKSGTNVTVVQNDEHPPEDLASNLRTLIELMRFNIQQPFDVWRTITFTTPLPQSKENYRLEHRGGRYRITPTEPKGVQIELDENWVIEEIRTREPGDVTVSIRPHYAKSPNGLLLSSIDLGNVDEPSQQIQMTVEYLEQEGLQLPSAFGSKSQHPGGVVNIPVKFDHYDIGRR